MDEEILEQVIPTVPEKDMPVPESTVKNIDKKVKELEAAVIKLSEDNKIKDMFILALSKGNIVLKVKYDQKLTAEEIDFLQKNCME